MDEPALDLEGVALSPQKEMVRVFYKELWDHADKSLISTIFHADFTFRGSLGPALIGHEQFAGYVDWVTGAFGQYTTDILVLIEEGNRVCGKMLTGIARLTRVVPELVHVSILDCSAKSEAPAGARA